MGEKMVFLKFNNKFKFLPRINRVNNLKFFHKNSLNIRRILTNHICFIRVSSLYKLYLKSRKGNPTYLYFLNLLESRLDVCLFRIGLFSNSLVLRKFILENNVYLNGNLVNKPGILLKKNDLVQFTFVNVNFYNYKRSLQLSFNHLSHLEVDLESLSFVYLGFFSFSDLSTKEYKDFSFL